jgi:hypothetical protein
LLAALTVPALAEESFLVDAKECHGDPFTFNGKRFCWTDFDNAVHPVKGKPPLKRPWLRLSASLPVGALPTYNGFVPPDSLYQQNFGSRTGLHEGDLVVDRTLMSSANLGTSFADRSWGARLRVTTPDDTPFSLDLSWTKVKPATIVQVFSSEFVTTGRYYEDCPAWEGTSPCADFGGKFDEDSQYNEHTVQLHVLRAGLGFDLLHSSGFLSLEPGLGVEASVAKNTTTVWQTRYLGSFENKEVVQDRESSAWLANFNRLRPYASLSLDIYPLGKDRFIALGATTRYLLASGDWSFRDATLRGPYEVPIRSRRWATSLYATLAF